MRSIYLNIAVFTTRNHCPLHNAFVAENFAVSASKGRIKDDLLHVIFIEKLDVALKVPMEDINKTALKRGKGTCIHAHERATTVSEEEGICFSLSKPILFNHY